MTRIPAFPEFREIRLDDAGEFRAVFQALEPEVAEYTFANLFLFRRAHEYGVSRLGGRLLVLGRSYRGEIYAFPPLGAGDIEADARVLCRHLAGRSARPALFPVSRAWAETSFSRGWTVEEDRNQADYVYLVEELATLPGQKFHKKKNRLAKFLREEAGGYEYAELADEHEKDCLELARAWCGVRCSAERPSTFLETEAVEEAVRQRRALGLRGGVILLGGRVRAFCLGEHLNADTFVVHFEKAEPGREGLAQLINRDFCRNALQGYRFVNREQDLGDPGLRQAKESYHPARLVPKYRVWPDGSGGPP